MNFLVLALFYFVASSTVLLVSLSVGLRKKIEDYLLVLFSFGVVPFIIALLFYAAIVFFPGKSNWFYGVFVGGLMFIAAYCLRRRISDLKAVYGDFSTGLVRQIRAIPLYIVVPCSFFIGLYSLQLVAYPIVDNDSVHYLNQSEAFYEHKGIDWQKEKKTLIHENDYFSYDSSVRPGIPVLIAFTDILQNRSVHDYASLKVLILYYYFLLLLLFLFVIEKVCKKLHADEKLALTFGLFFIVFSWGISRALIFSTKEIAIYFFTLFSLYIASLLVDEDLDRKDRPYLLTILAVLLGINALINLHGIVIEILVILVLFILSKQGLADRIKEAAYIILLSLPFGGFELLIGFNFIFLIPILSLMHGTAYDPSNMPSVNAKVTALHQNLYQFRSLEDEYLKGKFQILTNVGSFGIYFWIYIVAVACYFKNILRNSMLRFLSLFIIIYYVVVIDPFNLINHPLMIVLTGSQKYAMLLLFLSMIPTSVFLPDMLQKITDFLDSYRRMFIVGGLILLFVVIFFKKSILIFWLKALFATIPVFKDISFYSRTVETLYDVLVFVLLGSIIMIVFSALYKEKRWLQSLVYGFLALGILVPFFATNVGKVPLGKTFAYVNASTQSKLENTLYEGDMFRVYFQAKKILPRETIVTVDFKELYAYDDYFSLRYNANDASVRYLISANCGEGEWKILASSNVVHLCEHR